VGIVSLLWNAFGGYDYTMSQLRDPAYLEQTMGPFGVSVEQANAWLDGFPVWATALWAIGVWGSVLGSILLLIRSRLAVWAFVASFVGAAINFAYETTTEQIPQMADQPSARIMPLVILAAIALQWFYARRQTAAGVLR
jgi:uncharacterized membrane protein YphA (DoxX/SURF4 family)